MNPNMPQLSLLRRDDARLYKKAMGLAILRITEILNATNTLTPDQITELITQIGQTYYYLRFEEVLYVLEKGAYGGYVKDFNRIDGSLIMGWFERYDREERTPQAISLSQAQVAAKSQPATPMDDDELQEYYDRVAKRVSDPLVDNSHLRQKDRDKAADLDYQRFRANYLKAQRDNENQQTNDHED